MTIIVTEHQGRQLTWDVLRLSFTAGVVYVAHIVGASALTTVWAISASSVVLYAGAWFLYWHSLRAPQSASERS